MRLKLDTVYVPDGDWIMSFFIMVGDDGKYYRVWGDMSGIDLNGLDSRDAWSNHYKGRTLMEVCDYSELFNKFKKAHKG